MHPVKFSEVYLNALSPSGVFIIPAKGIICGLHRSLIQLFLIGSRLLITIKYDIEIKNIRNINIVIYKSEPYLSKNPLIL